MRELRNLMERLAYLVPGETIEADDLAFILSPGQANRRRCGGRIAAGRRDRRFQSEYIKQAIERAKRQHERSRRAPGPAPLEPVSQDAAARHARG